MSAVSETTATESAIGYPDQNGFPRAFRWTQGEYYRMADLGFFRGKRVQLIKGEIIVMSPMKTTHATAVRLLFAVLSAVFGKGFVIDCQLPFSLGKMSEPEPDVSVLTGNIRDFANSHPGTAALVVEVSDTSLKFDRTIKASLYAEYEIEDYWIVNLKDRCLEVCRQPKNDSNLGFIYSERTVYGENDSVASLAKPKSKIKVANILP